MCQRILHGEWDQPFLEALIIRHLPSLPAAQALLLIHCLAWAFGSRIDYDPDWHGPSIDAPAEASPLKPWLDAAGLWPAFREAESFLGWLAVAPPQGPRPWLVDAAAQGKVLFAQALCRMGLSPNMPDDKGRTPLHAAARHGQVGMVRALLELGVQRRSTDFKGRTASEIAARKGHTQVYKLLALSE